MAPKSEYIGVECPHPHKCMCANLTETDGGEWPLPLNHPPAWTKWPQFHKRCFRLHFLEWKFLFFDWNFAEVCSRGSNWQYKPSTGLYNGFGPNRRQAIIGTNVGPIHWRIYAALGEMSWKIYEASMNQARSPLMSDIWKYQAGHIMVWKSYSFVWSLHFIMNITVQTYLKALDIQKLAKYILRSVCLRVIQFSIISHAIHKGVFFQITHFIVMIVIIHVLHVNIIITAQIRIISHYVGFDNEIVGCAVRLAMFLQ